MKKPLRVLIVEDSEEDTLLIVRELKRGGFDPIHERVETAEAMTAALESQSWNIVIADYVMPHFSGLEALKLFKASGLDLPFIIVSGSIGEDVAVEAMKSGAHDYLMKNNLARLVPAIQQELREAGVRRKLRVSQNALQQSEKRYRQVIENATEIIYSLDTKGNFTYGNPAGMKVTGYSLADLRSFNYADLVLPEHRERVMEIYINQFSQRIPTTHVEFPFISKAGKIIWFSQNSSLVIEDGKVVGFYLIARDITERKQAEEALKASEEDFRMVADFTHDWEYWITEDKRLKYVSPYCAYITGYGPDEFRNDPGLMVAITHPDDRERLARHLAGDDDVSEKGGQLEFRILTKGGDECWIDHVCVRVHDRNGGYRGRRANNRDITERKRAEGTLQDSEARYRALFQGTADGILIADLESRIFRYANPAICRLLGYSEAELQTMGVSDIHPKADLPAVVAEFEAQARGDKVLAAGLPCLRKDGTVVYADISAVALSVDGRVCNVGFFRDITERKKAEQEMVALQEQLRQSQKIEAIGRLSGGIAHDFNNILTVISGNAQISLFDLKQGDPLRENIEEIRRASERAADLTRQLLAFSRKQIMEMQVLDLNYVVQGLDKMLHRLLREDIDLVTVLPEGIGKVKADPGQIEQVIVNLAVNSRDAMIEGGKLTIETANVELDKEYARKHIAVIPGRYVMLSVSDTGVGITSEVKERIFEPFFTTKEQGKGTGLGLSTVYGIVKQSEGNIWVYSEPGQGTTFKIYLPQVDEPLTEEKQEVVKEIPRGNETILVVEDEKTVRKLAIRLLKSQGYRVLEAPDGGKALLLCEKFTERIHLILTDVVMPGMSGRKLAERLKQIHPEIKVLYMSGYTDNAILHHGILEPGINFMQKPFTLENLARKVREALDH